MQRTNEEITGRALRLDHELPASNAADDFWQNGPIANNRETDNQALLTRRSQASREQLARRQADLDNTRKRLLSDQQEFQEYALFDAIQTLLPVLDSLEQAQRTSVPENSHFRGLELVQKQLLDVLFKMGVRPIQAKGQLFNPALHHALGTVETDLVPDQLVVDELQAGYLFKDRLLRPSMVKVATNHRE